MSMCYCEQEKLLVLHDYFKKEIVFLHHNIICFKQGGVLTPSIYGNQIKLGDSKKNLFFLSDDSTLVVLTDISNEGFDRKIVIEETHGREIESFCPIGDDRVVLGVEGGQILVFEIYPENPRGGRLEDSRLLFQLDLAQGFHPRSKKSSWDVKFGSVCVKESGNLILASTYEKDNCNQRDMFLLKIDNFGTLTLLQKHNADSSEVDSGYGFLDVNHSIYDKNIVIASQMKTGSQSHLYFIDDDYQFKLLFSFQINPEGFTCSALSKKILFYTLSSQGKFQIFPLGFHKYALPYQYKKKFSEFIGEINTNIGSSSPIHKQRSWKQKSDDISGKKSGRRWMIPKSNKKTREENSGRRRRSHLHAKRRSSPLAEIYGKFEEESNREDQKSEKSGEQQAHPFCFDYDTNSDTTVVHSYKENSVSATSDIFMRGAARHGISGISSIRSSNTTKYRNKQSNRITFGLNEQPSIMKSSITSLDTATPSWSLSYFDSKVDLRKINQDLMMISNVYLPY